MSRTHDAWPHLAGARPTAPPAPVAALVVALVTALVLTFVVTAAPAGAAPTESRLTLAGPPSATAGESYRLTATLRSGGSPVGGAPVQLERQVDDGWAGAGSSTTDGSGVATFVVAQDAAAAPGVHRVVFVGDGDTAGATSEAVSVALAETASDVRTAVPAQGVIGLEVDVRTIVRRADDDAPVGGVPVRIERRHDGEWVGIGTVTTDDEGRAATTAVVREARRDNAFRAVFAGTDTVAPGTSEPAVVEPVHAETELRVGGPARVVDETQVTLTFRWRARDGRAVPGVARVWSRAAGQDWRAGPRLRFGKDGTAELRVGPRVDSRWKAVGAKGAWWSGDVSEVHGLDNVPPGDPVSYPAGAPRPRVKLPRQARAVGDGPNATVGRIPNAVWNQMTGRSWHAGCPVGRSELRLVRINYWGYDGYRYRGELVVRDDIAGRTVGAFSALYRARLPIRSMYRVDRFGWSSYLHGGDNYESMAAGNTSGFNCRGVVGNPSVPSPHSYGRSVDINTWENPYHSRRGWVPNTWWVSRSHPVIAWRSREHAVVRIMRNNGFSWTYGAQDAHHFDG